MISKERASPILRQWARRSGRLSLLSGERVSGVAVHASLRQTAEPSARDPAFEATRYIRFIILRRTQGARVLLAIDVSPTLRQAWLRE